MPNLLETIQLMAASHASQPSSLVDKNEIKEKNVGGADWTTAGDNERVHRSKAEEAENNARSYKKLYEDFGNPEDKRTADKADKNAKNHRALQKAFQKAREAYENHNHKAGDAHLDSAFRLAKAKTGKANHIGW